MPKIAHNHQNDEEIDQEEVEEQPALPKLTKEEVEKAYEAIKLFWIQQDRDSSKELQALNKLHDAFEDLTSREKKQTTITDFFLKISLCL